MSGKVTDSLQDQHWTEKFKNKKKAQQEVAFKLPLINSSQGDSKLNSLNGVEQPSQSKRKSFVQFK